jgi:hypothetical protein
MHLMAGWSRPRLRHRSNDETALTEGRGHAVGLYSRFKWRWKLAKLLFDQQRSSPRVAARRCSLLRRREPVFPSNPHRSIPQQLWLSSRTATRRTGLASNRHKERSVLLLFSFVKHPSSATKMAPAQDVPRLPSSFERRRSPRLLLLQRRACQLLKITAAPEGQLLHQVLPGSYQGSTKCSIPTSISSRDAQCCNFTTLGCIQKAHGARCPVGVPPAGNWECREPVGSPLVRYFVRWAIYP